MKTQKRILMGTFVGKGVIVTGGMSGLGEAAALKFTREGAGSVSGAVPVDGGAIT
ncbi:MAG: NAD(P)-dependent dehydrogenase (short-subunit alcohol dehydrogenase family) [Porticoccus sp.]